MQIRFAYIVFSIVLSALASSAAWALGVQTQTRSPTACANNNTTGSTAWSNPANAYTSNDSYATAALAAGTTSNYLLCSNFGFSIPAGATITGISVDIERKSSNNSTRDNLLYLVKNGTIQTGSNGATNTNWPTSDATEAHPGATALWGNTWTPADINANNFGAALSARNAAGGSRTMSVDALSITISYTTSFSCSPPAGSPAGLTCVCDEFLRGTLSPSTIFNTNWIATTSDSTGILPRIADSGYLRLTENSGNNAKSATVPAVFPALGNYFSVEFRHYAYNGSGADGIAFVLSDYSVPASPGAFGGSLGYAQRTGIAGFAGGWIGMALDEFGNFSNPTEGRIGGVGAVPDSVTLRGSGATDGSGVWNQGYRYLAHNQVGNIDYASSTTRSYGHNYQVVVDARANLTGSGPTAVTVNRDTGTGYSTLINLPDIYATATGQGFTQAPVPINWQISFTGSTGGSTNIHEITDLRICAANIVPPTGGTPASFNAIDEFYPRTTVNALQGQVFTKLTGTPFALKIAALRDSNGDGIADGIETGYVVSGTKNVRVELIDDSVGASCNTSATACSNCSKPVIASQNLSMTASDTGFKQTANFTVANTYSKVLVRMCEGATCPGTLTGCSVDTFVIRPTQLTVATADATNATLSGNPAFKASTDSFNMTATANAGGYTGTPKIATSGMAANGADWLVGTLNPVAFGNASGSGGTSSVTTAFTYSEVGNFLFKGYAPGSDTTTQRGVYDDAWTAVDAARSDCIAGSYSNTKDATTGKYGCNFGLVANTPLFGRFIPASFELTSGKVTAFCPTTSAFVYMDQPALGIAYRLEARNGAGGVTSNYSQSGPTPPYPVTTPQLVAEDQAAGNQACDLFARLSGLPAGGGWVQGKYQFNADASNNPATATTVFSRPATPIDWAPATCAAIRANGAGPFQQLDLGVKVADPDGIAIASRDMNADTMGVCAGAGCSARKIGSTAARFGRLWIRNAYGPVSKNLALTYQLQYWNGQAFVFNTNDSCTPLTPANIALDHRQGGALTTTNMSAANIAVSLPAGGTGTITLTTANVAGSVDVVARLGSGTLTSCPTTATWAPEPAGTSLAAPWLLSRWCGAGYDREPVARATFGIFGNSDQRGPIYIRENH